MFLKKIKIHKFLLFFILLSLHPGLQAQEKEGLEGQVGIKSSINEDAQWKRRCDSLMYIMIKEIHNSPPRKFPKKDPKTLKEAVELLENHFTYVSYIEWMKCCPGEYFVSRSHFNLGLTIRNEWKLWKNSKLSRYFQSKGVFHPDKMSDIILLSFHQKVVEGNVNYESIFDEMK